MSIYGFGAAHEFQLRCELRLCELVAATLDQLAQRVRRVADLAEALEEGLARDEFGAQTEFVLVRRPLPKVPVRKAGQPQDLCREVELHRAGRVLVSEPREREVALADHDSELAGHKLPMAATAAAAAAATAVGRVAIGMPSNAASTVGAAGRAGRACVVEAADASRAVVGGDYASAGCGQPD